MASQALSVYNTMASQALSVYNTMASQALSVYNTMASQALSVYNTTVELTPDNENDNNSLVEQPVSSTILHKPKDKCSVIHSCSCVFDHQIKVITLK